MLLHDVATPYVEPMLAAVLRQAEAEFDVEAYRSEYWDARGYFLIPTYSFRIPNIFLETKKSFVVGKVGRAVKHLLLENHVYLEIAPFIFLSVTLIEHGFSRRSLGQVISTTPPGTVTPNGGSLFSKGSVVPKCRP